VADWFSLSLHFGSSEAPTPRAGVAAAPAAVGPKAALSQQMCLLHGYTKVSLFARPVARSLGNQRNARYVVVGNNVINHLEFVDKRWRELVVLGACNVAVAVPRVEAQVAIVEVKRSTVSLWRVVNAESVHCENSC